MSTTTLAIAQAWDHIVSATLYAIDNDDGAARQELAAAERIMPVPEEAWRAVLGAAYDDWHEAYTEVQGRAEAWRQRYEVAEAEQNKLANEVSALTKMLLDNGHLDLIEQHAKEKRENQ